MKVNNETVSEYAEIVLKDVNEITKNELKLYLLENFVISNIDLPVVDRRKLQVLRSAYKLDDWVSNFYANCIDVVEYDTKIKIKKIEEIVNNVINEKIK